MKNLVYLFSLLVLINFSCKKKKEDPFISLKNEDKIIIESIGASLPRYEKNKQYDSIIVVSRHLHNFMRSKPYLKNAANTWFYTIGEAYSNLGKLDSAAHYFKKAIVFFETEPNAIDALSADYVRTVLGMIAIDRKTGDYDKAIKTLYSALVHLKGKRPDLRSKLYYQLGYTYWYSKHFDKAEECFRKSLQIPEKSENTKFGSYIGLGDVNLSRNKLDSALYYFQKASNYYLEKENKSTFHINEVNKAEVYIKRGDLKKSKALLSKALRYYNKHEQEDIGRVYLLLAEIATLNKKNDSVIYFLKKSEPFIETTGSFRRQAQLYDNFSNYYDQVNRPILKNEYDLKLSEVTSVLNNSNKRILVDVYELKHLNELNEFTIKAQEKHLKLKEHQNRWLSGGLIVLFLLLLLLVVFYKKWSKTQKDLSLEKLNTLTEIQKVKTIQSHLNGQNKERKRIAKDLHDSISGNLAAIKMKLSSIKVAQTNEIDSIIESLDATYNEVRNISHNLLPKDFSDQSFVDNIHQLISLYHSKNLKINLNAFPEQDLNNLSNSIQIEVYRIIQELITNIVKHADANNCFLNITLHDDYLNVMLEDDGIGYDPQVNIQGIGLQNITSRINSVRGSLDIDTAVGKGTTTNINIPII